MVGCADRPPVAEPSPRAYCATSSTLKSPEHQAVRPGNGEAAGPVSNGLGSRVAGTRLDRAADRAQDLADLAAEEDQGDDRDDRDEGEDQRVLRETLAFVVPTNSGEETMNERHCGCLLDEYPPPIEGSAMIAEEPGELH